MEMSGEDRTNVTGNQKKLGTFFVCALALQLSEIIEKATGMSIDINGLI